MHLQRLLCDEVISDQTQMPTSWPSPHPEASGSRPTCRPSSSHIWAVIKPLTDPAVATCSLTSVLQAAGVSVATGGFLEERDGWSLQPFCTASPPPLISSCTYSFVPTISSCSLTFYPQTTTAPTSGTWVTAPVSQVFKSSGFEGAGGVR